VSRARTGPVPRVTRRVSGRMRWRYNHRFGDVAQLGERRVRNAKVEGSIPFVSTTNFRTPLIAGFCFDRARPTVERYECVSAKGAASP
jgi:hypothetical protein